MYDIDSTVVWACDTVSVKIDRLMQQAGGLEDGLGREGQGAGLQRRQAGSELRPKKETAETAETAAGGPELTTE